MIIGQNNHGSIVQRGVNSNSSSEEIDKQKEALQKRSDQLRELLKNSVDTVEISDEARAMSEAAREPSENDAEITADTEVVAAESKKETASAKVAAADTRTTGSESAKDYNKILKNLRAEYGEEEAMRRFDKIMKDDGYERVSNSQQLPSLWLDDVNSPLAGMHKGLPDLNNYTHSYLKADIVNNEVKFLAGTYANFTTDYGQEVYDALEGVYQKNLESAQSKVSFDLDAYMKDIFGGKPETSAVSASTELGTIAANLLKSAGVELGGDDKVSFSLKDDGSGLYISGDFENPEAVQAAVDAALQKDPSILKAFKDEYNSVAMTDTSDLAGAYNDGTRSVEYSDPFRFFTYSAKEPSAVVMTDTIGVNTTGYSYQKKVSDSFDVNADVTTVVSAGLDLGDPDYDHQRVNRELEQKVREALESGEQIESTMSQAEYDSVRAARSANFDPEGDAAKARIYSAADTSQKDTDAARTEASQALRDLIEQLEANPNVENRDIEVSYMDDKREIQKANLSKLMEMFNPKRTAPGLDVINSIMESLRSLTVNN